MALSHIILWIHALCGVLWVMTCASFVLAGAALSGEAMEWRDFALRTAPRMNRLCAVLASTIVLTGIGNLTFAARAHRFILPTEFVAILCAKITLFALMALMLWMAWGAEKVLRLAPPNDATNLRGIRKLMVLYGLTVTAGAVALALGLWLSGT